MPNFNFYNVTFARAKNSDQLLIRGEIQNRSVKSYAAVAIRIICFNKSIPLTNTVIVVNGVPAGQTKLFDKRVEDLTYDRAMQTMTRHEIFIESAY
ncbi:MAG: hypothetical protein V1925_02965 [Candidatus Omnitrophota bacterium]